MQRAFASTTLARLLVYAVVAGALAVPAVYAVVHTAHAWHRDGFADLRGTLWSPGRAIRAGASPYPSPTPVSNLAGSPSVYPPPLILVAGVPLSLLRFQAAGVLWVLVLILAMVASLLVLGVRDWRCHAVALLSIPVVTGLLSGNSTLLLVLLVATAWRFRNRQWLPGLALACALAMKPFVLPLLVWLAATRRWRALLAAVVGAAALVLAGWAAIGFDGFRAYPRLLANLGGVAGPHGASVYALVRDFGAGHSAAEAVGLLIALAVLVAGRASFDSAVLASLVATPVIWTHYFALLFVVAAAASRSISPRWLLPVAFGPTAWYIGETRPAWVTAVGLLAAGLACVHASRRAPEHPNPV
jgi:glycosyl transferase family 87